MRLRLPAWLFVCAGIGLVGCGGGGSTIVDGGPGSDLTSGPFSVRSLTPMNSLTMAGQNAIVVGFSGSEINFARLQQPAISTLSPTDALRSTVITWHTRKRNTFGPVIFDYGRGEYTYPISGATYLGPTATPAISPQFDRFIWSPYYQAGPRLESALMDGSAPNVLPGGTGGTFARYSPNAQQVAYISNGEIVVANASGSSPVTITNEAASVTCLDWRPDGSMILYGTSDGKIRRILRSGGTPTTILNGSIAVASVSWSDNYKWLGIVNQNPSAKIFGQLDRVSSTTTSGADIRAISFSPDGSRMACVEPVSGDLSVTVREAYDITSANPLQVLESNVEYVPHWSRYLDRKTYIGSGGSVSPTASGFLYSLTDGNFAAFVSFISPNPATVQLLKGDNSVPSQGILAVTVNAPDGLSSVRYQNRLYGPVVSALSTAAEGAIIAFDADDGRIQFILPYSDSAPARAKDGSWQGNFLGVYDADGKNLAPNGAREVNLEKARATVR